jgi:tryptophan 2,3-dioxygenase
LRELAERIRAAVSHARTDEMKQLLAGHAFRLAQVAEQLDRTVPELDALVRRANIERYERLLGDALTEHTRRTVEALLGQENAALDKERRQIAAWRRRAGEVRAIADQFEVPSVQETMRRTAANLDMMADHAEALLTGRPKAPGEETG